MCRVHSQAVYFVLQTEVAEANLFEPSWAATFSLSHFLGSSCIVELLKVYGSHIV